MVFLKPADIVILGVACAAVLLPLPWTSAGTIGGADARLFVEAESPAGAGGKKPRRAVYPLSADAVFRVEGAEGTLEVAVEDGAVRVLSSPCANKLCENSPAIHRQGEWIACMPGRVIVRIVGGAPETGRDGGIDSVSY